MKILMVLGLLQLREELASLPPPPGGVVHPVQVTILKVEARPLPEARA